MFKYYEQPDTSNKIFLTSFGGNILKYYEQLDTTTFDTTFPKSFARSSTIYTASSGKELWSTIQHTNTEITTPYNLFSYQDNTLNFKTLHFKSNITYSSIGILYGQYNSFGNVSIPMTLGQKERQFKERFSEIIQSRYSPNIFVKQDHKRKPLPLSNDIREQRARETLKRVIGYQKYVNFIKHGFISVKSKSGLVYQIFTGHGVTNVFDKGNLIERLCVVFKGDFTPTDSIIMRYLIILSNEQQFRSLAIKHSLSVANRSQPIDNSKSLLEIFKEMKSKVA